MDLSAITDWFNDTSQIKQVIILLALLFVSLLVSLFLKKYFLRVLTEITKRSKTKMDDYVFSNATIKYIPYFIPLIILYYYSYLFPEFLQIIQRVITSVIILLVAMTMNAILTSMNDYYNHLKIARGKPIKGYVEIVKIIIYIFSLVIIIGILTGESPWILLSGVGALTAVIILVFRDTILSFVASLQISNYDLVRVGDWIEVPKYGADGDVIDIALHTVKVQNWDKTITIIPTHKLIEDTFKNWRGMQETGGRRVKRSIFIDQNSIIFVDEELLKKFMNIQLLKDYIQRKTEEIDKHNRETKADLIASIVNGRRMTNLGTFRAYLSSYLKNHPRIHQGLTNMVRQQPPGEHGIPLEIYCFTSTTKWLEYESIQADIFDHILSILPEFELNVFQLPSGRDFKAISSLK